MKPRLTISMMQLDPLPKPAILSRKIKESYNFIDHNKNLTVADLPVKYIKLWRVRDVGILDGLAKYPITDDTLCHPSVFVSLVIFSYIYSLYYKGEDYADFQNFLNTYNNFQEVLSLLLIAEKRNYRAINSYKIFDLGDLTNISDSINQSKFY